MFVEARNSRTSASKSLPASTQERAVSICAGMRTDKSKHIDAAVTFNCTCNFDFMSIASSLLQICRINVHACVAPKPQVLGSVFVTDDRTCAITRTLTAIHHSKHTSSQLCLQNVSEMIQRKLKGLQSRLDKPCIHFAEFPQAAPYLEGCQNALFVKNLNHCLHPHRLLVSTTSFTPG